MYKDSTIVRSYLNNLKKLVKSVHLLGEHSGQRVDAALLVRLVLGEEWKGVGEGEEEEKMKKEKRGGRRENVQFISLLLFFFSLSEIIDTITHKTLNISNSILSI